MLAYKADFFLYMSINIIFYYTAVALWFSVYKASGITEISSYTLSNTITYMLLSGLLFRLDLSNSVYLSDNIWDGYFTNDLIKPWSVTIINFVSTLTDVLMGILTFAPFFIIMIFSTYKLLDLPSLFNLTCFLVTVFFAFLMNFYFNMMLHSLTFHFGDQQPLIEMTNYITSFLAGAVFPIVFLSGFVKTLFLALPFKYLFFVPSEIFLGKMNINEIIHSWLMILIWTFVFFVAFRLVYMSGVKKYSGTGR